MSRDRRGNRTQEVTGSIVVSSTTNSQLLEATARSRFVLSASAGFAPHATDQSGLR
jgi:hypothetical protein